MLLFGKGNLFFTPIYLNLTILLTLSIIDLKYLEISGKSYIFLIIPSIASVFTLNLGYTPIISLFIILLLFVLFDKLVGIEGFGGADIKTILILSLCFTLGDIFQFIYLSFAVTIIFYLILAIKQRKFKNIKIPMICTITLTYLYMNLWIYFKLFS
jgi:hypothetical protein